MNSCHLAVHKAVRENKPGRIRRLVGGGLDVNGKDDWGQTPLHIAATAGNTKVVRLLLRLKANVDSADENLITPLHICAESGKADALIVLLEFGANANVVDNKQRTALHVAAEQGYVEIAWTLIEKGARLDLADKNGDTALFVAVENDCGEIVDKMLRRDSGGIAHARDPSGKTPLHVAVILGHESIARALITAGADKDLRDKDGKSPCDYVKHDRKSMNKLLAAIQPQNSGDAESFDGRRARLTSTYTAEGPERSPSWQASLQPIASSTHSRLQGHHFANNGLHSSASSSAESQSTSLSSANSRDWTPDIPFGTRSRMLRKLWTLSPNAVFADKYIIFSGVVAGKSHMRLAQNRFNKRETVIIKFYCEEEVYSNVPSVHSALHESDHICNMVERLTTERTSFPPSIVFEKGSKTLEEWLMTEERSVLDKKWCLHQVLLGLRDAHRHGFVHGDLKPSHIVLFGDEGRWKLIDWDGAQKEGTRMVAMTPAYAAPEVVVPYYNDRVLPLARKSLDIWSIGIIAYETLTGIPFFGKDASLKDVLNLLCSGEVNKKLEQIPNATERKALSSFLAAAPDERWNVIDALQDDLFTSDDRTTTSIE